MDSQNPELGSLLALPDNDADENGKIELGELERDGLSAHVMRCWREAKTAKYKVEQQMLKNLRQRRGEYDPDKLEAISKQGLSDVFLKLTDTKCRGAESWIRDVLLPAGDKPWSMTATPMPELPQELEYMALQRAYMDGLNPADTEALMDSLREYAKQEAIQRAERMERLCEDQQVEGGFRSALDEVISDVVTLKAGILKAPVVRIEPQLRWDQSFNPVIAEDIKINFERISPFDFYPAPGAKNCQQAAYIIEHHHLQPADLEALTDVEGYDADAIHKAIDQYSRASMGGWLQMADSIRELARSEFERSAITTHSLSSQIDGLQYFGQVKGQWLLEMGADPLKINTNSWYEAEVWVVGGYVIKAVLNEHPLKLRPYFHTGAIKVNDQFWHQSIPELMDDSQVIINASVRALVNNVAIASGPQIGLDHSRIPQGFDWQSIAPWKVWPFKADDTGRSTSPIQFFQPQSNATELVAVLEKFKVWSDEITGIPAYTQGIGNAQGAGATASGLSMLMNAAAKGIRSIIFNIDRDIIEPMLRAQFIHNMLYHTDNSVKGDIEIKPRGAAALIVKEQMQLRRGEFMANTANPIDMQIIGMRGRAALLREAVKTLDMPVDLIVPPDEQIQQQLLMQQQQAIAMQQQAESTGNTQNITPDGSPAGGQAFSQF